MISFGNTFSEIKFGYIDADLSALQPGRYVAVLCDGSNTWKL